VGSSYLKTLYSLTVLTKKYYEALRRGTTDQLVEIIVAEECQNYIRGRRFDDPPSIGERVVYELRGFGVGVILVCPDSELLPQGILKDVGVVVSMSPDTLPRFALERYLFRASLEEAERTLGALKKAKMVVYYAGKLHYLRRLPRPPRELKLKARPKGDRMGVTDSGVGSLQAWPILPHRSPGRPKVVEVEEEVEEMPKVIEVKAVEVEEPLKLEEEELEEAEVTEVEETREPKAIDVKVPHEQAIESVEEKMVEESVSEEAKMAEEEEAKMIEEEMPMTVEPQPAPKGPPIPSTLPYWVQGRPA
jgi:hypothetical protein